MKINTFYISVLTLILFSGSFSKLIAQTFECRVSENEIGYLVYEMRETSGTNTPTTSSAINDITFVIRYPKGAVDLQLLCSTNDYKIFDGLNGEQTSGNYDYHYWNASAVPAINPPHDWVVNQWEEIAVFKVTGATGSGLFEVAPDHWDGRSLNWNQNIGNPAWATDFTPTIIGSGITYSYPTLVYDYVWVGGNGSTQSKKTRWQRTGNWVDQCNSATSNFPAATNNVYIPDVSGESGYFPETSYGDEDPWACNNLFIADGAHISVPDLSEMDGGVPTYFDIHGNLKIADGGKLYLPAKGHATVTGSTQIDGAAGIEVQADATGVGSFIDNGTITYGTNGSGKVQTFMKNSANVGSYYMHYVGPTVNKLTGSNSGVTLNDFDLASQGTFAYAWDEANGWVNIHDPNLIIAAGDGIALSTTDATDHTIEMTGSLLTGNVTTPSLTYSNNHYELISNPYPSSIDFQQFALATGNTSVINAKYWVWDPSSGNYKDYSYDGNSAWSGSAGRFIQVGQGFFVQTISAGTVTFANSYRVHDNTPFRDANANALKMKVSGGGHGFTDELNIVFTENATYGYDDFDTYKWNSIFEDATMIRSIADDGSELSINFLPLEGLQGNMVSVPVNFKCGYAADYTFDFEGIDSFEAGNEIWLEDKQDNDQWIKLNGNPHYTFSATPDDPNDRFILHFFGPTGVDENTTDRVDIYSWGQYACIKNISEEKIIDVSIYDISGHLVTEKRIPEGQKLNKIWVADNNAYYLVKVITEKNVYANKILITK